MSATHVRCGIEDLVVRIQADFLATPCLALRLPDAEERFGVDRITCEAVLDTLAEAHVLERSRLGVVRQAFPAGVAATRERADQTRGFARGVSKKVVRRKACATVTTPEETRR